MSVMKYPGPGGLAYGLGPLEHWDHGFECRSRHVSEYSELVLELVWVSRWEYRHPVWTF